MIAFRSLRPCLFTAALAAPLFAAAPAAASCGQVAWAYANLKISLVDPLNELKTCIDNELEKSKNKADDADAKPVKAFSTMRCRANAARLSQPDAKLPTKDLVELKMCVEEAIKIFKSE